MIALPGYTITEKIHAGEKSIVYKGLKSDKRVVIKIQQKEYPDLSELNSFLEQFNILKNIDNEGIVKTICTEKYKNRIAIIFEDIDGTALSGLISNIKNESLPEKIKLLIKITNALQCIHHKNIVHRDIKPHNIILNENTDQLQIIDFGSASLLTKQNSFIPLNSSIEGTLTYISPEQTGRMNRTVDYRSDYYSLGITFYQLLTGEPPFISRDPMELVHAHIARTPVSPFDKNKTPKIVSDIVMKLLQKNPEDRYQSAAGLLYDLELIASDRETEDGKSLQIGSHDFSGKFQIPEKLYGRESETEILLNSFDRVSKNKKSEMILICGSSGMGKSALIQELNKPITKHRGYFILGKFDQYKRDLPYNAVIQAFTGLTRLLLTESETSIRKWKKEILLSLGADAGVMTELIPELELLIGKQEIPTALPPTEAQNRFNNLMTGFVKIFATEEHALAFFLDDVQWADSASLKLLKLLSTDSSMNNILIICSYRDNEVDSVHPLTFLLEELKKENYNYKILQLAPLKIEHVNQLIAETLFSNPHSTRELALIVHNKTGGNPFFVTEFIKALHMNDLITLPEIGEKEWKWEIEKIRSLKISENVVDLMAGKIQRLSEDIIAIMKLISCIGTNFRLNNLLIVAEMTESGLISILMPAIKEGMILIGGNNSKFAHDKVREAAYSLMSESEKEENHYKIGKLLLKNSHGELLEERIFDIAGQFNLGKNLIQDLEERLEIINLNLRAAKKAKTSTAYDGALGFLYAAVYLLPENHWTDYYSLSLAIYRELSECEYLSTHFSEAESIYSIIYKNCNSMLDKIPTVHVQLRQKVTEAKGDDAFKIGFAVLGELGIKMPDPSNTSAINSYFTGCLNKYNQLLDKKSIAELFDLPDMTDDRIKEAISLITNLGDIAIVLRPDMLGLMSIQGVLLSIEYGNAKESPISYVMWGIIVNILFKDYRTGYDFGQLGLKINQHRFPDEAILAKCQAFYGWNINHWIKHCKEDMEIARKGYEIAMKNSDIVYAGYFIIMLAKVSYYIAMPLDEIIEYNNKSILFGTKYKYSFIYNMTLPTLRTAFALQGKTDGPTTLNSPDFSEEEFLSNSNGFGQDLAYYHMRKLQLYYLFGEYRKCLKLLPEIDKSFFAIPRHIVFGELQFFSALSILICMPEFTDEEKSIYAPRLEENYSFLKMWSQLCEDNFLHQYYLIEAEKARIEGRDLDAMQFYDKSIKSARQYDFIHNAGIANELAAKFYLAKGLEKVASYYIYESVYLFNLWGATAKVIQIEEQYSDILKYASGHTSRSISSDQREITDQTYRRNAESRNDLDINTVMKASLAISREIQLAKLLEKMLLILFENAGAERGFFILKENEVWTIEAKGNANTGKIEVLKGIPLDENVNLSLSIVNYVIRTKSIVLLHNAAQKGMFVNDDYVKSKQSKSVLCYPIIHHGNLVGVVYLENNLTTDAFTPDRVEILKILSSQIAVSLENSLLYANLEEKVNERTRDLNQALVEVRKLKEQQDGDYFLNTLLIEPLIQNNAKSKNLEIESIIKQKKKFTFRQEEYELGGDINITENLKLQGVEYTVFLNGDAMGKSLQGAGGVLVLGTIFKSIIQRTVSTNYGDSIYPERWLSNAFIEMHKAFESFDGSMLMSAIFGLIDEKTGTLYFINADHPEIILYRDEIARFLPSPHYHKLGTQGRVKTIKIEVTQLLPEDILILGSDGRDDIIVGRKPGTDNVILNEDGDLILSHVQNAKADLSKIYESIINTGEPYDDLSLLKIHYKGKGTDQIKKAADLNSFNEFKEKNEIEKLLEHGKKIFLSYPYITNLLYELSVAAYKLKLSEEAIDFGERVRLREPQNIDNLISLVYIYKDADRKEHAIEILEQCKKEHLEDFRLIDLMKEIN